MDLENFFATFQRGEIDYHLGSIAGRALGTTDTARIRAELLGEQWGAADDLDPTIGKEQALVEQTLGLGEDLAENLEVDGRNIFDVLAEVDRHAWTPHSIGIIKERNFWNKPPAAVRSLKFRERIASHYGCDTEELVISGNTTDAMCMSLNGLGAGLGPDDVSLVLVHDAFANEEIEYYELLGFCDEGEGEKLLEEGETAIGGRIPFSTDGGLIARGHPGGPTGLAQIHEITLQLRGEAGRRQVEGARVGLAHLVGGGSVCIVNLLRRE